MKDFTQGGIMNRIVLFSVPMLIGNLFQQMYNLADAMIVGQFVGGKALAAVGSAGIFLGFLIALLMGLCTGASVVVSQFFGARQERQLKRTISTTLLFLVSLAVLLSAIGYVCMPLFLGMLRVPDDVFDDTLIYLRILMFGVVFLMLFNLYDSLLRALGDSRTALYCLIFSVMLNLVLDYLFVAVLHWGVAGAAYATVASMFMCIIPCYAYISRKIPLLKLGRPVFDRCLFRVILRYSIPAALQLSLVNFASLTIMRLVNTFGSSVSAGYSAALRLEQIALMPANSISMASASFVGQNIGAGLEQRARRALRATMVFMVCLSLVLSAVLLLFGQGLLSLFLRSSDANYVAILTAGTDYLRIIALFYCLHSTLFAFNGFFRGVGDAVIVMVLTVTSLTIRSLGAYAMVYLFGMGTQAIAFSIPIGWFTTSLIGWIYYARGRWRGKSVVG